MTKSGRVNDAQTAATRLGCFDIYFDCSLKQIHDRGYLQAIIDLLPQTDDVKRVADHILAYTTERIKNV